MEKTIRKRITRQDSVTGHFYQEEEDPDVGIDASRVVDDIEKADQDDEDFADFEDSVSEVDGIDQFEDAQETAPLSAAVRVFHDEYLLERILLHNSPSSTRSIVRDLSSAMRVDKIWRAAIKNSLTLQRTMWLTPSLKQPPASSNNNDDKIYIHFNPILWPTQPSSSTIQVSNSMLNTGIRGPGSWRKMLVASASKRRFMVVVKVDRTQIAIVKCDANTTMGMLLELARQGTGKDDFDIFQDDEPVEEDFFCVCVMQGLPMWQRCDECLRDGAL